MTSAAPGRSNVFTLESRLSSSRIGARHREYPDGDVDEEDPLPAEGVGEDPAHELPAAAPNPPTAPQTPSAMLRSRPSWNVVERIESAAGVMIAAPSPWKARAVMSDASDQARPAKSEARVKTTRPPRKIRLRPRRSAERPPRSRNPPKKSAYALITHCRFSWENPRSTWIDGSATFTMAMSRTTMNWTTLRSASASHFRFAVAV